MFPKKFFILIACILLLKFTSSAQTVSVDTVKQQLNKALQYIIDSQYRETKNYCFKGEWRSTMGLNFSFPLLGHPQDYDDQNCFTAASIHNSLARIYLSAPEKYSFLQPTIDNAYTATLEFRDSVTFNFWHKLPSNLSRKKKGMRPDVRRPTTFPLNSNYIKKAANVMDDADDTSEGFMAMLLHNKMTGKNDAPLLLPLMWNYRDEGRKNYNWYNYVRKDKKNSGAYLTWLGEEKRLWPKTIVNTFLQNQIFYLPLSEDYPFAYKPYMPYGTNDVDAVVNANVLTYLACNNEIKSPEHYEDAVAFIYRKIERGKLNSSSIYYPNRYYFHFVVSNAYTAGIDSLQQSVDSLMKDLLLMQQPDGSFACKKIINDGDKIQSTAYALHTMLNAKHFDEYKSKSAIEAAINFLLNNRIESGNECYWKGGVFFSGGTVVRKTLFFKSDAYTTALICEALNKYLDLVNANEL